MCPMPVKWHELYELLPNKYMSGCNYMPSAPLILAAWWTATDEQKRLRLKEHLFWAEQHGGLERVFNYLNNLSERDWYHEGD